MSNGNIFDAPRSQTPTAPNVFDTQPSQPSTAVQDPNIFDVARTPPPTPSLPERFAANFAKENPFLTGLIRGSADFAYRLMHMLAHFTYYNLTRRGFHSPPPDPNAPFQTVFLPGGFTFPVRSAPIPDEDQREINEGTAFVASFMADPAIGMALKWGPVARALGKSVTLAVHPGVARWGRVAASGLLGGSIYGSIRDREPGESRLHAVAEDALFFAGGDVALHLLGRGLKRYILEQLPPVKRRVALQRAKEARDRLDTALGKAGVTASQLPPEAQAIEHEAMLQAIREADPSAVNLGEENLVEREQARLKEATTARAIEERFEEEIARTKPTEGPAPTPPQAPFVAEAAAGAAEQLTRPEPTPREVPAPITGLTPPPETLAGVGAPPVTTPSASTAEAVVAPAVRGFSGKVYVGGPDHPATMAMHLQRGTPPIEFAGPLTDAHHPNRGFSTTRREFVSREEAATLAGQRAPLFSEDLHQRLLLPDASRAAAEADMARAAQELVSSPETPPVLQAATLIDAVTNRVAAEMHPAVHASPELLREAAALKAAHIASEIHVVGENKSQVRRDVAKILLDAMASEDPGADTRALMELTDPTPREMDLEGKPSAATLKPLREALNRSLQREKPPIDIGPYDTIRASSEELADLRTGGPGPSVTLPAHLTGLELAGYLGERNLKLVMDALIKAARSGGEGGAVPRAILGRIASTFIGSNMLYVGTHDQNLPPSLRFGMGSLGLVFLVGGLHEPARVLFQDRGLLRNFFIRVNPRPYMTQHGDRIFGKLETAYNRAADDARDMRRMIEKGFPDKARHESAMYAIEEGAAAPEFHLLPKAEQDLALDLHRFHFWLGLQAHAAGVLKAFRENYVSHFLDPTDAAAWRERGYVWRTLPGGSFQKQRIFALRDLVTWLGQQGRPGPVMDPARVISKHFQQVSRAIEVRKAVAEMESLHLIRDEGANMPPDWRPIKIADLQGKWAPDAEAAALEHLSTHLERGTGVLNALDRIRSTMVGAIMFHVWEHGINQLRSSVLLQNNFVRGVADYARVLFHGSPLRKDFVDHGGVVHERADLVEETSTRFDALIRKIPALPEVVGAARTYWKWNNRILWDHVVPAIGDVAYQTNVLAYVQRRGGIVNPKEFEAFKLRAAKFANTVSGHIPTYLADPKVERGTRLLLFAPKWVRTRLNLLIGAGGEISEMMAGKLDPRDTLYLPFKLRQVAWTIALSEVMAAVLTNGKRGAQYNPNTNRMYVPTGLRRPDGRELGIDLTGWWQDDSRIVPRNLRWAYDRLNPAIKVAVEQISGRDYLGREMTFPDRLSEVLNAFGPPGELVSDVPRVLGAVTGGEPIRGYEAVNTLHRLLGVGNAAILPRDQDVLIGKIAKQWLIQGGAPATDENVWELSRIIRSNLIGGVSPYDTRAAALIAYRRRAAMQVHPARAEMEHLWQEVRRTVYEW